MNAGNTRRLMAQLKKAVKTAATGGVKKSEEVQGLIKRAVKNVHEVRIIMDIEIVIIDRRRGVKKGAKQPPPKPRKR